MAINNSYSKEENDLLLKDLKDNEFKLEAESFERMESLWLSFFHERKRKAYALYLQTIKLAKENNLKIIKVSIPKRDRTGWKKPGKKPRKNSRQTEDKIYLMINEEIKVAVARASKRIMKFANEIVDSNNELRKEVSELRAYKNELEHSWKRSM